MRRAKKHGVDLSSISPYLSLYTRLGHPIYSPSFNPPEVSPILQDARVKMWRVLDCYFDFLLPKRGRGCSSAFSSSSSYI